MNYFFFHNWSRVDIDGLVYIASKYDPFCVKPNGGAYFINPLKKWEKNAILSLKFVVGVFKTIKHCYKY